MLIFRRKKEEIGPAYVHSAKIRAAGLFAAQRALYDATRARFKVKTGFDAEAEDMARHRLFLAASRGAEEALFGALLVEINLPFFTANREGPLHLAEQFTQLEIEALLDATEAGAAVQARRVRRVPFCRRLAT